MAHLITALILLPIAGALVLCVVRQSHARGIAFAFNALSAALAIALWRNFDTAAPGLQMVERHNWIPAIGAEYLLGVDGLSLLLVLLTSLLFPFAFLAQRGGRGFCALMLLMQSALYGTFTAQNFLLWFLFYEMSLVPAFLLIKIWGGEKRDGAATKFFVYTFLGSVAMLLSFLAIYFVRGTFDLAALATLGKTGILTGNMAWLAFAGIFLGLAVKVPLFPFHTWLPDAYESAPVGVSMVLTGVLSKMGVYGFIRLLLPLFPHEIQILGPWLLGLAVCSIVFASLAAWAQSDLKRMVAYLSINHLGYCLLGLFAIAASSPSALIDRQAVLSGVFIQIFNHGVTAAALFYFVGLLEERRGLRGLNDFGGLMQRTPLLCGWMSVAMFSSLGLPGLNGFIGEFLIFKGSFAVAATFTAVAALGLLVTAIVFLRAMQALFTGPLAESCGALPDLYLREKCIIVPVTMLMFALGIAPQFVFNLFNTTVVQMARLFA
ncbi:MAG: NADH-quinone oxidoreductase subunit M [Verrucomicrobia bacterium]|nr:MAG: NADH-quinone oxidoreductase subunit M [Verrucomicrobiota bacterium]HTD87703.1 NADH-quinone oxidoreductase subunit M [Candidatus Binatia bacterium]